MTTVAIVTPWWNTPELIPAYAKTTAKADQLVIVDNGSAPENAKKLDEMVAGRGVCIHNPDNYRYSKANNQGLEAVTCEYVVFLNSDIEGDPLWIDRLKLFLKPGALCGPSMQTRHVDRIPIAYLEGWCIAGKADEIRKIGGWNEVDFPGLYYEDNEFCWRAARSGLSLVQVRLPLNHINNYTSKRIAGSFDRAQDNRLVFEAMVRRDREAVP